MIQSSGQFVPVKLNGDKEGKTQAAKFRVSGFPNIVFVTSTGDVVGRIAGYMAPEPFLAEMNKIAGNHKDLPVMEARLKAKPNDAEAAGRLAGIQAARGDLAKATELLAIAEKSDPRNATKVLGPAYNALGDMHQEARRYDKAIPLFRKAAKVGKTPHEVAYARISIAVCLAAQGKLKEAIPELETMVKDPSTPKDLLGSAKQMLTQMKRSSGGR